MQYILTQEELDDHSSNKLAEEIIELKKENERLKEVIAILRNPDEIVLVQNRAIAFDPLEVGYFKVGYRVDSLDTVTQERFKHRVMKNNY